MADFEFVSVTGEIPDSPPMVGVGEVALNNVQIAPFEEWVTLIAVRVRRNPEHTRIVNAQGALSKLGVSTIQAQYDQFVQMGIPDLPALSDLVDATQLDTASRFVVLLSQTPEANVEVIGSAFLTPLEVKNAVIQQALVNLGLNSSTTPENSDSTDVK